MLTPQVFTSFDLGDPKQQKVFVNQVSQWLASLSSQVTSLSSQVSALQALTRNFITLGDTVSQPGQNAYFNNLSVAYSSPGNTITVTSNTYISAPGPLLVLFYSPFANLGSQSVVRAIRQSDGAFLASCNSSHFGQSGGCLNVQSNTQVGFQWGYSGAAETGPPGLTVYAWQFAA